MRYRCILKEIYMKKAAGLYLIITIKEKCVDSVIEGLRKCKDYIKNAYI